MKKIIGLTLVISIVFFISSGNSWARESLFSDVDKNHWAYESIEQMHKDGIIAGYPDKSFKPSRNVSYGEFIKMLAVTTGASRPTEKNYEKHWALPFYEACLNNFYFTEWDISEKKMDIQISRKDMALVISGAMGPAVKITDYGDYKELMAGIDDVDERHSHEFHIIKAYATGVLSGYPDGTFRPDEVLTRAEAASVIWRLGRLLSEINKSKIEQTSQEESKPLVDRRIDPPGYPKGSMNYIIFNYHDNTDKKHKELGRLLEEDFPEFGAEMFSVFEAFMEKPISQGGVGLRKQYFGKLPVFMEHMSNSAAFSILPIGYEDPYWGIKPGQVDEYIK